MANANCKFWQSQLDEQEKKLAKYKEAGKLPEGVAFSPYVTFQSFIKEKEQNIEKLKKDLLSYDCANDPLVKKYKRDKCLALNQRIISVTNAISGNYQAYLNSPYTISLSNYVWDAENLKKTLLEDTKDFSNYNCNSEIEKSRQEVVGNIASEYSAYDKKRIDAESIYERNKRVFFGGVVLLFGLGLIMTFKKSKSK